MCAIRAGMLIDSAYERCGFRELTAEERELFGHPEG